MHIPRSPRAEAHIAATNHQHKSSLRDPGSPNPHKDFKVRFAQADQVKEFESGPAAATNSTNSNRPDINSAPNGLYYPSEAHSNSEGMPQSASPSYAGATAAQQQPSGQDQPQPQQQYPAAPYGYYYNPYAYAQYAQMNGQGWPSQQVSGQAGTNSTGPAQATGNPAAAPLPRNFAPLNEAAPHHDSKRMQMMARSVSITVNPPHQDGSSMPVPGGVVFGHGGVGSMMHPLPVHMTAGPTQRTTVETEEEKELRLLKWAGRRLRWSCMHRVFKAWLQNCEERWWKTQVALRDQQAQLLAAQIRHVEFRPVRYIRRYKMKQWLGAWEAYALRKCNKHIAMQRAEIHALRALACKAFAGWMAAAQERRKEEEAEQRGQVLYARRKKRCILHIWRELVGRRERKEALLKQAEQVRSRRLMRNALGSWAYLSRYYRSEKISSKAYSDSILHLTFKSWKELVWIKKEQNILIQKFYLKHAASLRQWAFYIWLGFAEGRRARSAHEFHSQLSYEVERLRQENERLARVVDSGDWGRDRVAELTQAGQVLQQERDALVKLVESLPGNRTRRNSRLGTVQNTAETSSSPAAASAGSRRGSLAQPADITNTRGLQASGIAFDTSTNLRRGSSLKPVGNESQTASTVAAVAAAAAAAFSGPAGQTKQNAQGGPKPAPLPANLRAKMTVRAGSSFNALVRALKQDLLTSGAIVREPDAAFAVDKISAQSVEVTAGGGIKIEAVGNAASPGFSFTKSGLVQKQPKNMENQEKISSQTLNRLAGKLGGRSVGVGKRFGEESSKGAGQPPDFQESVNN